MQITKGEQINFKLVSSLVSNLIRGTPNSEHYTFLRDVKPRDLLEGYRRFGEAYCLYI